MAVAEHSDNIELQDIDDTDYDDVGVEDDYEQLDVQQTDDATYEDVAKTKREKDLKKILHNGK